MDDITRGQVNDSAAQVYDQFFLPALFKAWPERVLATAGVKLGQDVLDVACGTGVLALAAAEKVGPDGAVIGLDVNAGMLAVARGKASIVEWRRGRAEELPFPDRSFDVVVCQFGLMFFDDRRTAIREMMRVLRPGGRLVVVVWDTLENTPGYLAVTRLLHRLFGDEVAEAIRAPYMLGDKQVLHTLFASVDLAEVGIQTHQGMARFPSLDAWMYTDVKGWTLAGVLDDAQFELLLEEAKTDLGRFVGENGKVTFPAPAHFVRIVKD
ncbi:MAG: class I SAM-dependent methyltransferase [Anaerolineales bacterium]|nr:class I SAM-dependent methyltransferase [Anaerolineales bacterium]